MRLRWALAARVPGALMRPVWQKARTNSSRASAVIVVGSLPSFWALARDLTLCDWAALAIRSTRAPAMPWAANSAVAAARMRHLVASASRFFVGVADRAPGDIVAVSVIVDSCGECEPCRDHTEIYCEQGPTNTYDGIDRIDGSRTRGGYAESLVAHQRFVHPVPDGLDLAGAAPLLCAGVTVWSPLRHWEIGPASKVGVVGIGGLGHLGVKFAHALGAHVVAFTTPPGKRETILVLDTVSTGYPLTPIMETLRRRGRDRRARPDQRGPRPPRPGRRPLPLRHRHGQGPRNCRPPEVAAPARGSACLRRPTVTPASA